MGNEIGKQSVINHNDVKILIVDDSGFSRSMISKELCYMGIENQQIWQACNGDEAIKEMQLRQFDLFILDIVMTGIDGVTVLKEVKKKQPNAKIVICSGCNSDDLIKGIVQLGIDAFIVKPYNTEIFKKVLCRVLSMQLEGYNMNNEWIAKCHVCDRKMTEVDSIDMVSFYCSENCMKLGPLSNVLVTQAELDQDYEKAKEKILTKTNIAE